MRRPIAILLLPLFAVPLVACGSASDVLSDATGPDYSGEDLAKDVRTVVNRDEGMFEDKARQLECEDIDVLEKGAIADCEVLLQDGSTENVRVKMEDDQGHFWVQPY